MHNVGFFARTEEPKDGLARKLMRVRVKISHLNRPTGTTKATKLNNQNCRPKHLFMAATLCMRTVIAALWGWCSPFSLFFVTKLFSFDGGK